MNLGSWSIISVSDISKNNKIQHNVVLFMKKNDDKREEFRVFFFHGSFPKKIHVYLGTLRPNPKPTRGKFLLNARTYRH